MFPTPVARRLAAAVACAAPFASDAFRQITGQDIAVDGGRVV